MRTTRIDDARLDQGALVTGLLATVSAVACAFPAVGAARVDPMLVVRDQERRSA